MRLRLDQPKPKQVRKVQGTHGIDTRVLDVPLTNLAAPLHLHTLHRTAAARAKHTRSYVAFFPTKRQIPPGRGPVNRRNATKQAPAPQALTFLEGAREGEEGRVLY